MNFSDFLKNELLNKKFNQIREFFDFYNDNNDLGVDYRAFNSIYHGKRNPSFKLLIGVFKKTERHQRKVLINSYFVSMSEKENVSVENPVSNFIDVNLDSGLCESNEKFHEKNPESCFYSKEQLDFLVQNPEAIKMFKSILIRERVPVTDKVVDEKYVLPLKLQHLVDKKGVDLVPYRKIFRIPTEDNSAPPTVEAATKYLLAQVDQFVSTNVGVRDQKICHATQMVHKKHFPVISQQLQSFLNWIYAFTTPEPKEDHVPLFFFSVARQLEQGEI